MKDISEAGSMRSAWLLTTRLRTILAAGLTAFELARAIRDVLRHAHTKPVWPLLDGALHGWVAIAVNFAFYGYLCWLAFWFIYRSEGRERLFMIGWFAGVLLSPLKILGPLWAVLVNYVGTFGFALSLVVALSLLLQPLKLPPSRVEV